MATVKSRTSSRYQSISQRAQKSIRWLSRLSSPLAQNVKRLILKNKDAVPKLKLAYGQLRTLVQATLVAKTRSNPFNGDLILKEEVERRGMDARQLAICK